MIPPRTPDNEPDRLLALERLELLYTPAEERFDRITRMASRLFGTPIALVTLLSGDKQWFKSAEGLDVPETPREISFCGHAILDDDTLVVEDATDDDRFRDNPLVTGDPNIRFYAGHPIYADDGSAVGTMCIIDREARGFSDDDRRALRDLAALVETELHRTRLDNAQSELIAQRDDAQRKASIDGLTRLWNHETIRALLAMELSRATRGVPLSIAMIDVDRFKEINDIHGHQAGDRVLSQTAALIRAGLRDFDAVGRYGGDEFMAVLSDCQPEAAGAACERIRRTIERTKIITAAGPLSVTVTIGVAGHGASYSSVEAFIEAADQALYRAKKGGRNRTVLAGTDRPVEAPGMTAWRRRKSG